MHRFLVLKNPLQGYSARLPGLQTGPVPLILQVLAALQIMQHHTVWPSIYLARVNQV